MRILQIGMSPLLGGVESFIINYMERLKKYDIFFDFISMYDRIAYEDQIIKAGGKIYHVSHVKRYPVSFYKQLSEISKKYRIVHINMLSAANSLPVYACYRSKVKNILIHSHNSKTERIDRYILHYINKCMMDRLPLRRLACSDVAAKWMFSDKIIKNKDYKIIHNAINFEKFRYHPEFRAQIREEFGISENTLLIGSIGHLTMQKNPFFLISLFKEITKLRDNVKLILVGDGDLTDKIKESIWKCGIEDKVVFAGIRYDVNKFYSAIDVCCMTSLYEGLSFTAIEAQASGVQCFFSSGMSRETLITPKTEFLNLNNPKEWAMKIVKSSCNREKEAEMFVRSRGFDIELEAERMAAYYKSLYKGV